ncbi:MAG: thioredoxin family protein [Phycisphaerales bacterium]
MKTKSLFAAILAAGFALGGVAFVTSTVRADDPPKPAKEVKKDDTTTEKKADKAEKKAEKKEEKKAEGKTEAKIGETVPNFKLTDTDGKSIDLAEYGKGKVVVIEWYNPGCPFVVKHHEVNPTFKNLTKEYAGKDVVFLAVNSSAPGKQGHGKQMNADSKKQWSIDYPIVLDEDGKVGKMYGAKHTPDVYIVGKDGKLAYLGAVDNDQSAQKVGDKNYIKMAVDELLAGKAVTTKESKRYGCGVKY